MPEMNDKSVHGPLAFLDIASEVATLMRTHDWSSSPLGQPTDWPSSLRTVVSLLLSNKFAMFVAWGPELGFLYNDSYAEILGTKHPDALGKRFQDIWSEIWSDIDPLIQRALQGEATYTERLPLTVRRRGFDEQAWFTFSYSPVYAENGQVSGMYAAVVEVTAQVLAERYRDEENERLRTLFAQAPGFMTILRGPDHRFELCNNAYLQHIGFREVLGKPMREALPEVVAQGFVELLDQVYRTGETYVGTAVPVRLQRVPQGPAELRFVDFVYQPFRDATGTITGIFAEGNDVTERKLAEDELRNANRQKDEFLAMLAHELRNPLAPITTAAQLLKIGNLDAKAVLNVSNIIARQAEHMTALVDDLLDVSRVTRGLVTLNKEQVDLNIVVSNAVEQVRSLIDSRHHALTLRLSGEPAHVIGDSTRLIQVVTNLLSNSAKYTPPGGEITLRVHVAGGHVEVSVVDNGMGITSDVLPYVFDLFSQGKRTLDRSQGGLGIGLSLVMSLVELHGGTVHARSGGADQGSEFVVRLPCIASPQIASVLNERDLRTAGPLNILVVDDNADAAQTLSMLLEMSGHRVSVEYDARSALTRVQVDHPEVMLLDIGLPDIDGFELAKRIRALPAMDKAVLVAVSGYGMAQDRAQSVDAGFHHHLVKPVSYEQLNRLLAEIRALLR